MNDTPDERIGKLIEAQHLLASMVVKLRFYGMDDSNRLIRQANQPRNWIAQKRRSQ